MSREANFCMTCGAKLEIRAVHNVPRPVCTGCGTTVYFDPKVAVVVFIQHADQVLLVQRAGDPAKGKWALPAGFVEYDEPPEDAALRETLEETGLIIAITRLLDVFPRRDDGLANIVIAYAAHITGGELRPDDDAADAGWFTRDTIPELAFYPSKMLIQRWQNGEI